MPAYWHRPNENDNYSYVGARLCLSGQPMTQTQAVAEKEEKVFVNASFSGLEEEGVN